MSESFVSTSIARRLITRMQVTHERRRISVFSGPPGIGKTTAIDAFVRQRAGEVAVVKIGRQNAKEVMVLQHTLAAVRAAADPSSEGSSTSLWDLRRCLYVALCRWAALEPSVMRRGEHDAAAFPCRTIIFDEAQNLSRRAIEGLRYWNDADRCYGPFPVGLVFIGNNEFSLSGATVAESAISAAVADRALYLQTYEYDDVTDDDLRLFIEASRDVDPSAVAAIVRSFKTPRAQRSLRRVGDLLDDLEQIAGGSPISADTVRRALDLA